MAIGFSDGVGWCRVLSGAVGCCRVLSGLEVSGQGLSGLSVCEDACTLSVAVGAVRLSGCRVSGAVGWCQTVGAVGKRSLTLWCQACIKV